MNIDTLAHEVIKQREASKRLLDSGNLDAWLRAMPAEFAVAEELREHLLRHPVVVTDDPAVKHLLAEIDPCEVDDPDKIGMELLWGSVGPARSCR